MVSQSSLRLIIVLIFICICICISAQTHFARLSVSDKNVMAGQPFNVRITVYTPTWFTRAPDFGEYQVDNSFTLRTDRARSNYESISGKRYTTLYFVYVVFPLKPGKLELPPLKVQFESPDEGDYKGKPRNVTTNGSSLEILPVPGKTDSLPLFVANRVSISESWNKPLNNLKIGDVLERTIRISASGTLANMIPPLKFDSIEWASHYPQSPDLNQNIADALITSGRTEKHTYLLGKEGIHSFPAITLSYYNLQNKKWVSHTLPQREITVADNPDLAVLKSLQDSLDAESSVGSKEAGNEPLTIFGLSYKVFLLISGTSILVLTILYWLTKRIIEFYKRKHKHYIQSEQYHFRQLLVAGRRGDFLTANNSLYRWISELPVNEGRINNVNDLAIQTNNDDLNQTLNEFHKNFFGRETNKEDLTSGNRIFQTFYKQLKRSRFQILLKKRVLFET